MTSPSNPPVDSCGLTGCGYHGCMGLILQTGDEAKELVLAAKGVADLTWPAMAYVLGVPEATLTNWIRRPEKQPYGPAVVLCMEIAGGSEAWSDIVGHRIGAARRFHPDGRGSRTVAT